MAVSSTHPQIDIMTLPSARQALAQKIKDEQAARKDSDARPTMPPKLAQALQAIREVDVSKAAPTPVRQLTSANMKKAAERMVARKAPAQRTEV